MKALTKYSFTASTIAATLLIWGQNYAIRNINAIKTLTGTDKIALLLSAGTVVSIYKAIIFVYQRWAWKLVHPNLRIVGRWRHRLVRNDTPNDTREGEFEIVQSVFETKIVNGVNRGGASGIISRWRSLGVIADSESTDTIWVIYEIRRNREELKEGEAKIDNGLLRLDLIRESPNGKVVRMEGEHMDAGKSQRRGTFSAIRSLS